MTFSFRKQAAALATAMALALPAAAPVSAATPDNMLVMGMRIDDIITLDPAEVFELSAGEISANVYDRIMMFEPENLTKLVGGVVESWTVSEDGKTITFKMRDGLTFHSGNPVRAEDAVYSLRRVVKLNKTPAFIVTQFGWTPDNVDDLVRVTGDGEFTITITEDFSPGLVLNALSAGIASVVDEKLVESHAVDGDMGYGWLKNHSAGSGAFSIQSWKANESVTLVANPNYRHGKPAMDRVIIRHLPEPAAQRLLLEQGDIDIARTLTPDQIAGLAGKEGIVVDDYTKATLIYMAANTTNEALSKPKVWEALRWLVDYDGMANSFLKGQFVVHQTFWPSGLWASIDDRPYKLDIAKGKELLAEAGYPDGFEVTIDSLNTSPYMEIAQSLQQTLGQAGIKTEIIPQDGSALWPKYRARRHGLILARWSPDYVDPHSNADSFAHNPDNRLEAKLTGVLAWRNAWKDDEINALTVAARTEIDLEKRAQLYAELQRKHQTNSPFVIMFQQNEQVARRANVQGFVSGSNFDLVFYRNVTKQ
ncbi:MAG: ABC transporter substrate-binding protein [Alphaproteobacteria bacterium]|nr:MAG: ABC transporter substrate-binding protein [Alphaproteobacteria bacterium]